MTESRGLAKKTHAGVWANSVRYAGANLARASEGETPRCLTTSLAVIPEATYAEGFKMCKAYLKGTTRRLLP